MLSIIQAAGWPIWPLIACSIIGLAIIIERFVALKSDRIAPPRLLEEVLNVARISIPGPEVLAQLEKSSALGEILAQGLRRASAGSRVSEDEIRSAMEDCGRMLAHRLEKHLTTLGTIASAAPLLGLLGTVIGMIEIFGAQSPGVGAVANPAQLAHGISVALYNTAFGLLVAIPALVFWRFFRTKVNAYLLHMELSANHLMHHIGLLRKQG
ncbi:MAG: MotA/TolQ/ExbB proton channel family protein [Rhodoferax sp.]